MSLTATISTSASDSCAAGKTLRRMRPKPLMPTRTAMTGTLSEVRERRPVRLPNARRRRRPRARKWRLTAERQAVHVAVRDFDEVLLAVAEHAREVLGDRDRA